MLDRIERLERDLRVLRIYSIAATLLVAIVALTAFRRPAADDIVRTRGIIIVDDAGRERILIGAPLPNSTARLRTNLARAESAWAGAYPKGAYMKYYGSYRNAMSGMLVLDEHGVDRVMIGDSLPDPNVGQRLGSDVGMLINDARGFERSGYGLLTVRGRNRMVLGLDTDRGDEAVTLAVIDSGRRGIRVRGDKFLGFFGSAPGSDSLDATGEPLDGILLRQGKVTKRLTP